jgi:hypothetical protein
MERVCWTESIQQAAVSTGAMRSALPFGDDAPPISKLPEHPDIQMSRIVILRPETKSWELLRFFKEMSIHPSGPG